MSVADHDLRSPECSGAEGRRQDSAPDNRGTSGIWLVGDVLACACPGCGAPMSIRLWLRLADCWRCGTSVELTEEQQAAARALLEQRRPQAVSDETPIVGAERPDSPSSQKWVSSVGEPAATRPQLQRPETRQEVTRKPSVRTDVPPGSPSMRRLPPQPRHLPAAAQPSGVRARLQEIRRVGEFRYWLSRSPGDPTAWLVSLVLHMVLIIILGLWMISRVGQDRPLILALEFNALNSAGDAEMIAEPIKGPEFDVPEEHPIDAPESASPLGQLEAKLVDLTALADELRQLAPSDLDLPPAAATLGEAGRLLAGRDPALRSQIIEREGGTLATEAAVARGLKWLARHQDSDGRWRLDRFHHAGDCDGRCSAPGTYSDTAGTALALLPFLGAGQTHAHGEYKGNIARGLRWLVENQGDDGDLSGRGGGNMYAHGLAAIALCEGLALSRDRQLQQPAQKAIDFIVRAQHEEGGWRYSPGQSGDTSVVGWQLMALRSAEMAYLKVPAETFNRAARFLDSVQMSPSEGLFGYRPGSRATRAMTAEGLLCRQYSGWQSHHPPLLFGVEWLLKHQSPRREDVDMYYWYYATQVMHHAGGDYWYEWNKRLRDLLVSLQETRGHEAGSWTPRQNFDTSGGRLYMTALAVCTLEVYYRHLPLYRLQAIGPPVRPKQAEAK